MCVATPCTCGLCQQGSVCRECLRRYAAARVAAWWKSCGGTWEADGLSYLKVWHYSWHVIKPTRGRKSLRVLLINCPMSSVGYSSFAAWNRENFAFNLLQQAPYRLSAPLSGSQSASNQPVFETGLRPLSCSLLSCGHVYRLRLRFRHMTAVCKILCRPEIFHVCRSQSARLHVFQRVTVNAFGAFFCIPAQLNPPLTFTSARRHRARCSYSRRGAMKGTLL